MTTSDNSNATNTLTDASASLMNTSMNLKVEFQEWLGKGNIKRLSPQMAIDCLDRISEYLINRKIACSIWEISKPSEYKPVQQKAMSTKLLRIMERKAYKTFTYVGQLYMKFLRERQSEASLDRLVIAVDRDEPSTLNQHIKEINPNQSVINSTKRKCKHSIFRKYVDLSLFNYGFTIPQFAINEFCANISVEIPRGESHPISLVIDGNEYRANLCNIGFTNTSRQQMQVRYTKTSQLASALRSIYSVSNTLFFEGKKAENKGYIEVVCISADKFELICHPTLTVNSEDSILYKDGENNRYIYPTNKKTIKEAIIDYSNTNVGKIKTRKEIYDELSAKYRFPMDSILSTDNDVNISNLYQKVFRNIGHDTYECLGYRSGCKDTFLNAYTMNPILDRTSQERVKYIIASRFRSGYRTTSSIDFERFKNYYADEYGEGFNSGANELETFVKSIAVIFDDRAYMYDEEVVDAVRAYLDQMNTPCFSIDAFFGKYSVELYAFGIFSVDLLRAFIERNLRDILYKRGYLYLQPDVSPSSLIRQVFSEREYWPVDELLERLPYINKSTIRTTLNGSKYLRIAPKVYTHIDNLDLPDNEGEKIVSFINERLESRDYVIAKELDLSSFEAFNPQYPVSVVWDAVYEKFLANSYSKNGQVITRIGKELRIIDILEQYCRNFESASVEELCSFEASLYSEGRRPSTFLIAAHNVMVRVSADLFVDESKVRFDVDRTDEAIALYCRDNFIPIKNVVDFSLFPYVGYPWNPFLLESYVRKFSHIFKYDARAVNNSNIGVIVRKSFTYDKYDNILAIALAESPLSLNNKIEVADYLFDRGYIGRRSLGKSEIEILANAKKIREGGIV